MKGFNSTLVQLKGFILFCNESNGRQFQFYLSSIKRIRVC